MKRRSRTFTLAERKFLSPCSSRAFSFIEILLILLVVAMIGGGGFWVKYWAEENIFVRQEPAMSESALVLADLSALMSAADFLLLERGASAYISLDGDLTALQKGLDRKLSPKRYALKADDTSVYVGLRLPSEEAAARLPEDGSLYYSFSSDMPGEDDRVPPKKISFPGWIFSKVR